MHSHKQSSHQTELYGDQCLVMVKILLLGLGEERWIYVV